MQANRTIAQDFECPSCRAEIGEPCRVPGNPEQRWEHVTRSKLADLANWQQLAREMPISTGWTLGSRS